MADETEYPACPVCASAVRRWRVKPTRYGNYRIDVCGACGFAFVNPRPSMKFLTEFYSTYGFGFHRADQEVPTTESVLASEKAEPNSTLDAQRLVTTIAGLLPSEAGGKRRFLDIGCGYGFFAREAIDRGFEVTALDLATNKRKVTQEITGLDPVASSFEDFDGAPASFAAVLMSQILEHVADVNLWISKAHTILADNGVLAIALPNFTNPFRFVLREKGPYIIPPEHLNFFSARSLSTLLERHGFKVESVQWVSRLPKRILKRRVPKLAMPLWPVIDAMSGIAFNTFDALHLGLMVNVYGRKTGQPPAIKAGPETTSRALAK